MDPAASEKPVRLGSESTELLQMGSALVRVRTQVSIRWGVILLPKYVYTLMRGVY